MNIACPINDARRIIMNDEKMINAQYINRIKHLETLLGRLNHIGVMLSAEKNTSVLIDIILKESMEITQSDAGSIYIKTPKDGEDQLKFMNTRNTSRTFPFNEFYLPIDQKSISGYCAYSGEAFHFNSMEEIPKVLEIHYNDYFDKQINYHTINMLVIPMKDIKGEVVGVLQLINKKKNSDTLLNSRKDFDENIIPYTEEEESIILSLASQTAVLIERSRLMEEIQLLFDAFVESMVITIEKRDPITSGHSIRVAHYVQEFAEAINQIKYGKYKDFEFTQEQMKELHYSALLHDVGKIGVSEVILQKQNRLAVSELSTIQYRFHYLKKDLLLKRARNETTPEDELLIDHLDGYCQFITQINPNGFLTDEEQVTLRTIEAIQFLDLDDHLSPLLTENELKNLIIKNGNLNNEDREQINLHAAYTYQILKDIPWIKDLKYIPQIAAAHHEKLDGTGYPNHLKSDQITLQSKILAIIDIFEALTARDRPYKKAMPVDKVLRILEDEASSNHVDCDLLEIFLKERIYEKI
jgi:HD-GYP domain-containing protein (c-di-GMP phosphodiesterase class II)